MPARDYYNVLGVQRHASPQSIRDAYRSLAKKYHPDVIGESGKGPFQEISEAYETLSDPAKRRAYNLRLEEAEAQRRACRARRFAPMSTVEPLLDFRSPGRPYRLSHEALLERLLRRFTGLGPLRAESPEAVHVEVILTPQEAARGVEIPLVVPTLQVCPFCRGTGRDWIFPCTTCGEEGTLQEERVLRLQVPPMVAPETVFEIPLRNVGGVDSTLRLRVLVG